MNCVLPSRPLSNIITTLLSVLIIAITGSQSHAFQADVSLVVYDRNSSPINHGVSKIILALEEKEIDAERVNTLEAAKGNILIVIGSAQESNELAQLLLDANVQLPEEEESLVIHRTRWNGKTALLVSGYDERGVMYAALEVADRIGWAKNQDDPLSEVRDVSEAPEVGERALGQIIVNQSEFEWTFFSEDYWNEYLDMAAKNRYNTFVMTFGYAAAGYFAPIYPYLFEVEGFHEVGVTGITEEKRRRNLEMLKLVIRKTHDRGMKFTLGFWSHLNRRNDVYGPVTKPTQDQVWGLGDHNLIEYTEAALAKFLRLDFGMDAIQFRAHIESAVTLLYQLPFWHSIYEVIKDSGVDIRVDMRAKGFPDDLIDDALDSGLDVRITTKYWGEQMVLPYHPTHITRGNQLGRRAGYADLLRYPKRYKMHYKLWNWGTTRFLIWGDPEYVRRFTESTHLYDGNGFEVTEPLAWKMARHREERYDILKPDYQYYTWEYERYWYFFQVFGRVGYNPDTPSEVWEHEFEKRFGSKAASDVEQGIRLASKVLPKINAYNLPTVSADGSWAEKQRWRDLPVYINSEPSDTQQFLGIKEATKFHLEGKESPKIWPQKTSDWFANLSNDILKSVEQAEGRIGSHNNKEFVSTMVDLKVLAYLAGYHSIRIHGGLNYASYELTQDLNSLDEAINFEKKAIEVWKKIILVTEGVYADDIIMGEGGRVNLRGHWKDELVKLENGLNALQDERKNSHQDYRHVAAEYYFGQGNTQAGSLPISSGAKFVRVNEGYGWFNDFSLTGKIENRQTFGLTRDNVVSVSRGSGNKNGAPDNLAAGLSFIHGPDPLEGGGHRLMTDMPSGDYELTFTMFDSSVEPRDFGPMWIVANGMDETEEFSVPAGKMVEKTLRTTVTDDRLNLVIDSYTQSTWIMNTIKVTRLAPEIVHVPVRKASPGKKITLYASVNGPDNITQVRIRYGSGELGYRYVAMEQTEPGLYQGSIRGRHVQDGLNYSIEAEDAAGRVITHPQKDGLNHIHVRVTNDNQPPAVSHTPISSADIGKPLVITAKVDDPSGVQWVRLRYRGASQHQDYRTLLMLLTGENGNYQAEIPASHIRPEWDLIYLFEVMDNNGNARMYPDLEVETPYIVVELNREDTN